MQQIARRPDTRQIVLTAICGAILIGIAYAAGANSPTLLFGLVGLVVLFWVGAGWRTGVAGLLWLSCVDGALKFLHSTTAVFVLKDAILLAVLLGLLVSLAMHPALKPSGKWRAAWPWFMYVAFLAVGALNPANGLTGGIAGFRSHALFALLFIVGIVYFENARRFARTANLVIAGIALSSVVALFQFALPDTWAALAPGFQMANTKFQSFVGAGSSLRAYGTMVDPAALGLACSLGILFAAAALARIRGAAMYWLVAAIGLMGMALLFSGSRASLVGVAVGMLALLLLSWRHKSMRTSSILALAIVIVSSPLALTIGGSGGADAGSRFTSSDSLSVASQTRARSANMVYAGALSHPFGYGLGAAGGGGRLTTKSKNNLAVDNLYLSALYETGFVGLALLLFVQATILFYTIKAANEAVSVETRSVYIGMAAAQVGLLFTGFWTQGSFDYAPVAQVFWLFAGAVALPKRVEGAIA